MIARVALRALAPMALLVALSACAPQTSSTPAASIDAQRVLPPPRNFGPARPMPPQRSNTEISRDFLDLSFKLESGVVLERFTRFDGPVSIALTGQVTPIFNSELDRLIGRLRREAGLNVYRAAPGEPGRITVEAITHAQLQRVVPNAACFVLPQRISWSEFRGSPRRRDLSWKDLTKREFATVFIPANVSPQEVRDCLHEEIAQALGPLNDLYRLEDSIFNDDNMHSVLTGFDMLVLRVTHDASLRNGMTREQAAAIVPGILARTNPGGSRYATRPYQPSPREWVQTIESALGGGGFGGRRGSAQRAVNIAASQGWNEVRMGLSQLTYGRALAAREGEKALEAFLKAAQIYESRPATAIHAANVGIQIAAFALAAGDMPAALRIAEFHIPAATRAENAALLADLLLVKSVALQAMGRPNEADLARRDSLAWGRYGMRSSQAVLARAAEIEALVSRRSSQ